MSVVEHQPLSRPSAWFGRLLSTTRLPSQGLKSVCVAEMLIHVASTKRLSPAQVQLSGPCKGSAVSHNQSCKLSCSLDKNVATSIVNSCVWAIVKIFVACVCPLALSFTFSFICIQQLKEFPVWLLQSNAWEDHFTNVINYFGLQSQFGNPWFKNINISL